MTIAVNLVPATMTVGCGGLCRIAALDDRAVPSTPAAG
jgi:hypothetical protein